MREIKIGEEIVVIRPKWCDEDIGKVFKVVGIRPNDRIDLHDGGWTTRSYVCHAPDPNHKYRVRDWVLPVVWDDAEFEPIELLEPMRIDGLSYEGSKRLYNRHAKMTWGKHQIVPITRTVDGYDINGTFLTAEEFHKRYWVEIPLRFKYPDKKATEPHDSTPPEVTDWPTQQDIEECCGVWGHPDGKGRLARVRLQKLQDDYDDRTMFNYWAETHDMVRIESIGTRIIPEKRDYDPYGLTEEQRARWDRVTEWD